MSSDVTDMWQYDCDITSNSDPKFKNRKINQKENEKEILNEKASIQTSHVWHMMYRLGTITFIEAKISPSTIKLVLESTHQIISDNI